MLSVSLNALSHIALVSFLFWLSLVISSLSSCILWLISLLLSSMRTLKKFMSILEISMHTRSFLSVEQSRSLSSFTRVDNLVISLLISFKISGLRNFYFDVIKIKNFFEVKNLNSNKVYLFLIFLITIWKVK